MNSIAIYCLADSKFKGFLRDTFSIHLGPHFFDKLSYACNPWIESICRAFHHPGHDPALSFGPIFQSAAVLLVLWLICFWMYRRKIFLRI
jgi:hypothetical protein